MAAPKLINSDLSSQMTDEMKSVYNDFFGSFDRLKQEWQLCNSQYLEAKSILEKNQSTFKARMEIRRISDYWIRRRQALERIFDPETIKKFSE